MPDLFFEVLGLLAVLAAIMLLSIDSARLFRKKESYKKKYAPKTLVIVPCKGMDISLYQNLLALKNQSYKKYKVIAVVDSENDEATHLIKKADISYIISEIRSRRASGKVKAIASALKHFRNYEAYVIADSDITVNRYWLSSIIAPLSDKSIGISTTYPRFQPMEGFWPKVKMVWNFVGENLLENPSSRFAWGGTMAFRKDMMGQKEQFYLINSKYSVSDDITLTKICKRKGMGIAYVKEAQPVVKTNDSFEQFTEWSNRQTALTLLGYSNNFKRGMFFYSSEIFVMVSASLLSIYLSPIFLLLFAHLAVSWKRSYARAKSSDPAIALIVMLIPFIYAYNLISARMMKRITWRGSTYLLHQ